MKQVVGFVVAVLVVIAVGAVGAGIVGSVDPLPATIGTLTGTLESKSGQPVAGTVTLTSPTVFEGHLPPSGWVEYAPVSQSLNLSPFGAGTIQTGAHGNFSMNLRPGVYVVFGMSPTGNFSCFGGEVHVTAGAIERVVWRSCRVAPVVSGPSPRLSPPLRVGASLARVGKSTKNTSGGVRAVWVPGPNGSPVEELIFPPVTGIRGNTGMSTPPGQTGSTGPSFVNG